MRPVEYTDEQIIAAGKQLQAEQPRRRLTASAIRMQLGGGNLTRIRSVWEAYLADAGQAERAAQPTPLPPEFQQDLEGMVTAMADDLRVLATRIYARANAIAEGRVREALQSGGVFGIRVKSYHFARKSMLMPKSSVRKGVCVRRPQSLVFPGLKGAQKDVLKGLHYRT